MTAPKQQRRAALSSVLLLIAACRSEAPPASVPAVGAPQPWTAIGHDLFRNAAGDLAFRTPSATEVGLSPDQFLVRLCGDGPPLKDALDVQTFHGAGGPFYADRQRVYLHLTMAGGGSFCAMDGVDASSFRVTGCYGRDASAVYTEKGERLVGVDLATFQTRDDVGCLARDRAGLLRYGQRVRALADLDEAERRAAGLLEADTK